MQDFVPSDHDFVIFGDDLLQALVEVRLQVPIVLHSVGMDEFLNFRIGVPLLAVDFVASDVKVDVGKQLGHYVDEHAAPGKARLIFDGGGGDGESGGSDLDELKKSLQASHDAE